MCPSDIPLRDLACALREMRGSGLETVFATYLWPLLTILAAVVVPVLLSRSAIRRAARDAAETAKISRATTLEAVQLQIDRETARSRADKRRDLVAELTPALDTVRKLAGTQPFGNEFDELRLLTNRLDLEVLPNEQRISRWLADFLQIGREIRVRSMQGVDDTFALEQWGFYAETRLRVWARLELSSVQFSELEGLDLRTAMQQGPLPDPKLLRRQWSRKGWVAQAVAGNERKD